MSQAIMENKVSAVPDAGTVCDKPLAINQPGGRPSKLSNEYYFMQGTADAIEVRGTIAALRNAGVDVPAEFPGPRTFEERVQVGSDDGHVWYFWGEDWMSLHASRPRTEAERERFLDYGNSRIIKEFFSVDRFAMARAIAYEILRDAYSMTPDKVMPRSERRRLQKKLKVLTNVQTLLFYRAVDMPDLRAQLRSVGMSHEVRNYWDAS